jgi:hypothetical protein
MKPRVEHHQSHRAKLPPILDLDDDDGGLGDIQAFSRPRWSSDGEEPGVSLGEWPTEYDD